VLPEKDHKFKPTGALFHPPPLDGLFVSILPEVDVAMLLYCNEFVVLAFALRNVAAAGELPFEFCPFDE